MRRSMMFKRHAPLRPMLRVAPSFAAMSASAIAPNVGVPLLAFSAASKISIGSRLAATRAGHALANSLARARVTLPAEPSPISRRLPSRFNRNNQERAPEEVTLKQSPSPSERRPGSVMVATDRKDDLQLEACSRPACRIRRP